MIAFITSLLILRNNISNLPDISNSALINSFTKFFMPLAKKPPFFLLNDCVEILNIVTLLS